MYDITSVGELLIDFTPAGVNDQGMELYSCNPGGAPANVLAMAAILGGKTAFIGKVGNDFFGSFLKQSVQKNGIDTEGLIKSEEAPTTLAFVHLDASGDRSFNFYRNPGADVMLTENEIKCSLIDHCRIFHFGSVSLTSEPSRSATVFAVKYAREKNKIVSFDPNYREPLWKNGNDATKEILRVLPFVDILKVSEEEMQMLTSQSILKKGAEILSSYGPKIILISLGAKGAFYFAPKACGIVPTYDVKTIDTNGAGDAFLGAFLYQMCNKNREELQCLPQKELDDVIDFANAAGSLTTTGKGAVPSMPDFSAIEFCRKNNPHII